MNVDYQKIWRALEPEFQLSPHSLHGPAHWRRVEANGLEIAKSNKADECVVRLFAVFHDVKRWNDGYDPEHGFRAAELARELHDVLFTVSDSQLDLLCTACKYHNDGTTSDQLTIGTCWDADRLDLPRVGIRPESQYMSTEFGKEKAKGYQ